MTPALLDRIDQIDAAWIEAVLHGAGHDGARVSAFRATPVGAGNVSDTVRLDIEYAAAADAPASVVAKFRPSDPAVHQHGLGSGAYHREIGAYRAISEKAACRIPELYWVGGDETNINLVVEDLTQTATPGNQVAGCSVDEARAVLTELARVHSAFAPLDEATAPAWPIRMADVCDYWAGTTRTGADLALARFRGRLDDRDLELVDTAGRRVREWYLLPQTRLTLTHGDPRVDNVLFERLDAGAVGAVVIDWQVTGLRNPMYDVGYFLSGSIDAADRKAHEHALIDGYLEVYAAGGAEYGRDEALADYRTQLLSGLMITTAAIAVLPDNEQVNALICALLERNCAAAADWDAFAGF
ncbi:hypothetical protein DSM112329_01975 [Paraconexibacter sp. AEG42_29]|uniref:CHK kinase-like domain-containing protein n=1 Tax=Paraconexibacter sp. AEG42_29 TaxID=2997339 RepID=A0AAU7ATW6_9ACTN